MVKFVSSDLLKSVGFSKVVCSLVKVDYENSWCALAKRIQYLDKRTRYLNL